MLKSFGVVKFSAELLILQARREKEKIKKLAKQVESLQKQLADKEATSDATHVSSENKNLPSNVDADHAAAGV